MPKLWTKSIGERGNRVRLYEPRPGANLMRSVYIDGKENRRSLGHKDRKRAIREAHAFLAQLGAERKAEERSSLTLGSLFAQYQRSPAHQGKHPKVRLDDEGVHRRLLNFFGAELVVQLLGPSDVARYVKARRSGHLGQGKQRPVRDDTIRRDLVLLKAALNWARYERDATGRRLIAENPLEGVELPREKNPRRPVVTDGEFTTLLEVAPGVHPLLRLALIVAEGTGRRLGSWRKLKWDDVDFDAVPFGSIRWRAENDKKGYEQVVPMSAEVRRALLEARQDQRAIGGWVFPSPTKPREVCPQFFLDEWLRDAYRLAEIEKQQGSLWHAFRRKWATERKGYPVGDVAAAGGWRDKQTLLDSYQQVDQETIKQVVLNPTMRLAR